MVSYAHSLRDAQMIEFVLFATLDTVFATGVTKQEHLNTKIYDEPNPNAKTGLTMAELD